MHPKTPALVLLLPLALSACATYHPLENKAACTLNADRAMVISMWGAFGIATNLRPEDTPRVCPPAPPR